MRGRGEYIYILNTTSRFGMYRSCLTAESECEAYAHCLDGACLATDMMSHFEVSHRPPTTDQTSPLHFICPYKMATTITTTTAGDTGFNPIISDEGLGVWFVYTKIKDSVFPAATTKMWEGKLGKDLEGKLEIGMEMGMESGGMGGFAV